MNVPAIRRHPSGIGYHIVVDPGDHYSPTIQRSSGAGFDLQEAEALLDYLENMQRDKHEKQNATDSL